MSHTCQIKHVAPSRYVTWCSFRHLSSHSTSRRHLISEGRTTDPPNEPPRQHTRKSPFYLETGYSIFAKRPTRAFPPPFVSYPSGSFSDPLTTHNSPQYRRPKVGDEPLRGITNGDDAILIDGQNFLAVNDGVGAWAQKDRGHAALWSRLLAHYWAAEAAKVFGTAKSENPDDFLKLEDLDPVQYLENAYESTKEVTLAGKEHQIEGTTTVSSALLHHRSDDQPVLLASSLGDCVVMVVRPSKMDMPYRSTEEWHWFDCPRQLGTNSPDTPKKNTLCDTVDVQEGDVILCLSDGVTDNLWEEEITEIASESMKKWEAKEKEAEDGVVYLARTLMNAAKEVALDPNAGSPYMSRAIDEGLAAEGGKLDDISVVLGVVRRHKD